MFIFEYRYDELCRNLAACDEIFFNRLKVIIRIFPLFCETTWQTAGEKEKLTEQNKRISIILQMDVTQ